MDETKLTVRIDKDTLLEAKRYARVHGTTLTRLVVTHLERLSAGGTEPALDAPVTRRLSGSLTPTATPEEYREHLERKHA